MIINVGEGGASKAESLKYDNSNSHLSADNVQGAIDEVNGEVNDIKEAFQDGCNEIVSGITAQGVTPSSNSPADIVAAVNKVATNKYNAGVNATKVGTAVESQVLKDKTFTNSSGVGLTGSMANNGAVSGSITTSGGSYTIPQGYHNGGGKVTGPTLAALVGENVNLNNDGNLLNGVTAYGKNGNKYIGSMANNGAWTNTPTEEGQVAIPAGYHNGSGYVDTSSVYEKGRADGVEKLSVKFTKKSSTTIKGNISSLYDNYQNIGTANIFVTFPKSMTNLKWVSGAESLNVPEVKYNCTYSSLTGDITIQASNAVGFNGFSDTTFLVIIV